jgi:hypothetical protein
MDNAPDNFNPDQSDIDNDMVADVVDACPSDTEDACNPDASTAESVGTTGGMLETDDGSVRLEVPASALDSDTSLSVTDLGTDIELGAELGDVTPVMAIDVGPDGTTFNVPVTLTFTWIDADNDGIVDGTDVDENTLRISQDGAYITGVCNEEAMCDTETNVFTVDINHFSIFALSGTAPTATPAPPAGGGSSSAVGLLELMLLFGAGLIGRMRMRMRAGQRR